MVCKKKQLYTKRRYYKTTRNYKDPLYVAWRKCVYSRDHYKCAWPGCKYKSKLNAHHIWKWASFPELRFIVQNGITLCYKHHEIVKGHEDDYILLFTQILLQGIKHV